VDSPDHHVAARAWEKTNNTKEKENEALVCLLIHQQGKVKWGFVTGVIMTPKESPIT